MRYRVSAFDPHQARTVQRVCDAVSEAAARASIDREGLVILELSPARSFAWRRAPVQRLDVRILCIELASLLRAGLGLAEALETLSVRGETSASQAYRELLEGLLNGLPFSEALEHASFEVPAILVAAVRANEKTGRIADALDEYARYAGALDELRRKVVNAAVYPLLVVGFGALVAFFLLVYVVPRFALVYQDTAAQISGSTQVLIAFGQIINDHGLYLLAGLIALIVLAVHYFSDRARRRRVSQALLGWKPIRKIARRFQLARITASLGMLLRGGYDLPGAMRLVRSLAFADDLQSALHAAQGAIVEGRPVSSAWSENGLADDFAKRILLASERTGELAVGFETLAATYGRELETSLERGTRLVEPVLLMTVASLIGAIVVLMYMPIFDLAGVLQ